MKRSKGGYVEAVHLPSALCLVGYSLLGSFAIYASDGPSHSIYPRMPERLRRSRVAGAPAELAKDQKTETAAARRGSFGQLNACRGKDLLFYRTKS